MGVSVEVEMVEEGVGVAGEGREVRDVRKVCVKISWEAGDKTKDSNLRSLRMLVGEIR